MTILNPVVWSWDQLKLAASSVGSTRATEYWPGADSHADIPVARIGMTDVRTALARGLEDYGASRTDVVILCAVYPVLGLMLGRLASGYGLLPLLFPLASGFALLGPLAALGLYELSRRREKGMAVQLTDAFRVLRSPSIGPIALLGMLLVSMFVLWLMAAQAIYELTLGPQPPVSLVAFLHDVLATGLGWTMIVIGMSVGFLFAVVVMTISVVSFPLLLEEDVGIETAVRVSGHAVAANPGAMAIWGLIVTAGLTLGSLPLLLGLPVVLPVLGHATWHLYRRLIPR